jgi:uncharacterized Zn-binding protein involved in type VI secretion
MPHEVYANGMEIAGQAGMNKSIARFPDVCLSPPGPPAGPIPVPYPDTSFSSDLKEGSATVKLGGKPAALAQQSYYQPSALGNEAATRAWGMNVVTHQITGKTYFQAWSMDVSIEGKHVCRHVDMTTSNHASYPGGTPPFSTQENMALSRLAEDKCPCCGSSGCVGALSQEIAPGTPREPLSFREFYRLDETDAGGAPSSTATTRQAEMAALACTGGSCPNSGKPTPKSDPPCDVYRVTTKAEADHADGGSHWNKAEHRDHHGVPATKGAINKAFSKNSGVTVMGHTKAEWEALDVNSQNKMVQIDHTTPRATGGCPQSKNNTQAHGLKCAHCKRLDQKLDSWSSVELTSRRTALGV